MTPTMIPSLDAAAAVPVAVGLLARMAAAVAVGGFPLPADVPARVRVAVAVALVAAALPAAVAAPAPRDPLPLLIVGEAIVGLGLGLAAAAVLAAVSWAGAILGSVSGLSWADDFAAAGDLQSAGTARLAWWLGLAGFLAAGGHLAVVAGLLDSVHAVPVGGGPDAVGWSDRAIVATGVAIHLALALAGPALAAVVAFHVASAVCLRAVRSVPGQGLLQGAAAVLVITAMAVGAAGWTRGFGGVARDRVADALGDAVERP